MYMRKRSKWRRRDRSKQAGAEVTASVERNENSSNYADAQSAPRRGAMVRLLILYCYLWWLNEEEETDELVSFWENERGLELKLNLFKASG